MHPLTRRREAAQRLAILSTGCADPWPTEHPSIPLTDNQLDMWRWTVEHLEAEGLAPLLNLEARRALWRRGGADRALAERLNGGEAA
ncbi:hypothetical protein [Mycobacterium sp. pW045]|uniref:hypothetical protein n=1 Tax=Mycobacterium sp. pW045 TaxID=3238984 RepID=UPI00351B972E